MLLKRHVCHLLSGLQQAWSKFWVGLRTLEVTLHCHSSYKITVHTHPTLLAILISDIHIRVLCYSVQQNNFQLCTYIILCSTLKIPKFSDSISWVFNKLDLRNIQWKCNCSQTYITVNGSGRRAGGYLKQTLLSLCHCTLLNTIWTTRLCSNKYQWAIDKNN